MTEEDVSQMLGVAPALFGSSSKVSLVQLYRFASTFATHAFHLRSLNPVHVPPARPPAGSLERTSNFLQQSRRPLIVVGSQVMLVHKEIANLQESLARMGAPVCFVQRSEGLLTAVKYALSDCSATDC